jgi:hypothetical protein
MFFEGIKAGLTLNISDEFVSTIKNAALFVGKQIVAKDNKQIFEDFCKLDAYKWIIVESSTLKKEEILDLLSKLHKYIVEPSTNWEAKAQWVRMLT